MKVKEALKMSFQVSIVALGCVSLIAVSLVILNHLFGIVAATIIMVVAEAFIIPFVLTLLDGSLYENS